MCVFLLAVDQLKTVYETATKAHALFLAAGLEGRLRVQTKDAQGSLKKDMCIALDWNSTIGNQLQVSCSPS
jgi:hypothetical protein